MTIRKTCGHCGSAILAAHAGRKYYSQACYLAGKRKSHERALELRYAAPKPLAKTDVHTVGQRVRVPVSEVREIGGKRDRIKQLGNAVTPPAMGILMQRCMESLR